MTTSGCDDRGQPIAAAAADAVADRVAHWLDRFPANAGLVVALSGGPDSTALLFALAGLPEARRRGLRAVHVHHGLAADADAWATHCTTVATRLNIPCTTLRVAVARSPLGLEGAARDQRYAALRADLRPGEVLMTAHHADDQAETVLSRLARAAGAQGLQGIHAWQDWPPGWLCRPLLDLPRTVITAYVRAHGLTCLDDPMNADPDRERTFLRHAVLPLLESRWPGFSTSTARSARLIADAAEAETGRTARDLAAVALPAPGTLAIDAALALPDSRLMPVLRAFAAEAGFDRPPARMLEEAVRQLRAGGTTLHLGHRDWAIRQYRRTLHVLREPPVQHWPETWDGREPLAIHERCSLVSDRAFPNALEVRPRIGGERIRLHAGGPHQELRDLFQRHGIPPWARDVPLLWQGDVLLAVGDWFRADRWDASTDGARLRVQALPDSLSA